MYEGKNVTVWYSWFFVFFWYIIFFPVGIYFTCKKLMLEGEGNGNIVGLVVCVVGFFMSPFLGAILGPVSIIVLLAILALFIYDINASAQRRQIRWMNEEKIVHGQDKISFLEIARNLGYPVKLVEDDYKTKINKGLFPGYYILNGMLYKRGITPDRPQSFQTASHKNTPPLTGRPIQPAVLTCPGCGAQNEITSAGTAFCEYCGKRLR